MRLLPRFTSRRRKESPVNNSRGLLIRADDFFPLDDRLLRCDKPTYEIRRKLTRLLQCKSVKTILRNGLRGLWILLMVSQLSVASFYVTQLIHDVCILVSYLIFFFRIALLFFLCSHLWHVTRTIYGTRVKIKNLWQHPAAADEKVA